MAKIIFICSDPDFNRGEQYTPEVATLVSIEQAARYAESIGYIVQAIDISDLSDVEDVTQQVAETLTKLLFDNTETVPQYALSVDMHNFISELEATVAEDNDNHRQVEADYYAGVL